MKSPIKGESALPIVVIISANTEWKAVRELFPDGVMQSTPFGEAFADARGRIFIHGGWGKISAAASAQYAIDRWQPDLLVNLGTCGGIEGQVAAGQIILAERTLVYDIIEQMGDPAEAIAAYATPIDLAWLGEDLPDGVRRALLVSADRDLVAAELPELCARYGAIAGDWESGAIAWVAARSGVRCLILRGVSDVVGSAGGEAYGQFEVFARNTRGIMKQLVEMLPVFLESIA
jgi:adenosylhomocysteine nucleosidase